MSWWNSPRRIYVRNPDAVSAWIKYLHSTSDMTFRQIHEKPYFSNIPPGTLCAIANGYPVPNKHRENMGLPLIVKVPEDMVRKTKPSANPDTRNRRAVNLDSPASAADTLRAHGSDEFIAELVSILNGKEEQNERESVREKQEMDQQETCKALPRREHHMGR